jgi:tripartite-type tricarboxylate transporter receptor subunit TctC
LTHLCHLTINFAVMHSSVLMQRQGILVPAGTPKVIIDLLHSEIVKVMALPDVKERMAVLGFEPVANTPEEFAARIKAEIPKWGKVIRDANIKAEP